MEATPEQSLDHRQKIEGFDIDHLKMPAQLLDVPLTKDLALTLILWLAGPPRYQPPP